jgi:hypothetical protein
MKLIILNDAMELQMRTWLQGFPLDHEENFPPFHKAQAPFVAVKGRSLGSVLFNFCQHLWWWSISDTVPCICFEFPVHIQFTRRHTAHITAFAHECFSTGDFAQLQAHMQDEVSLLWRGFLHHNTVSFKPFLKHWKLPLSLMQNWQHFLTTIWHDASQSARNRWTTEKAVHLKRKLSKFVCSPADHFPYTLTLHCPQQWRELLRRTFLDDRGPRIHQMCFHTRPDLSTNSRVSTSMDLGGLQVGTGLRCSIEQWLYSSQTYP